MSQNSVGPDSGADKFEIHYRQQLSALIDGELSADEARFILRRLQHDHELAGCIDRWQLCGAVLRKEVRVVATPDFSRKVAEAIEAEASVLAAVVARPQKRHGWARWSGGAALAASIAAVALFVGRENFDAPEVTGPATVVVAPQAQPAQPPVSEVDTTVLAVASTINGTVAATDSTPADAHTQTTAGPGAAATPATSVVPASPARVVAAAPPPRRSFRAAPVPPAHIPAEPVADTTAIAVNEPAPAGIAVPQVPQPRPWPRSSLPQSSDFFNAGYSGATRGAGAFGSFGSELPSQALFPPANDDTAPASERQD